MSSFYGNAGIAGTAGEISKALLEKIKEVVKFFDGDMQDTEIIFSGGDSEDETMQQGVIYDGGNSSDNNPIGG